MHFGILLVRGGSSELVLLLLRMEIVVAAVAIRKEICSSRRGVSEKRSSLALLLSVHSGDGSSGGVCYWIRYAYG